MNLINIYDQFYFIVIMKEIVKERNFTIELENDFVFIQQNIRANILSSKFLFVKNIMISLCYI